MSEGNATNELEICPGCKIKRARLCRGSWCTICGFNPVYEEKLGKVMREVSLLGERLAVLAAEINSWSHTEDIDGGSEEKPCPAP